MSKLHFTTKHANEATVQRDWYVVDGTNQTVGRVCSKIAAILRGKNKAYYTPHVDCGDFIVVINADKIRFTGNKLVDYFKGPKADWVNARRIVNGLDRADAIAGYSRAYYAALSYTV